MWVNLERPFWLYVDHYMSEFGEAVKTIFTLETKTSQRKARRIISSLTVVYPIFSITYRNAKITENLTILGYF